MDLTLRYRRLVKDYANSVVGSFSPFSSVHLLPFQKVKLQLTFPQEII
jgi:hypothetical protein